MFSVVPKFLIKKGASAKSFNYFEKKYLTNCKSYQVLIEKYFQRKRKTCAGQIFSLDKSTSLKIESFFYFFFGGGTLSKQRVSNCIVGKWGGRLSRILSPPYPKNSGFTI